MRHFMVYELNVELNTEKNPVLDSAAEEFKHSCFNDIRLVHKATEYENGTLHITTRRVIWVSGSESDLKSIAIFYSGIVLHAISKDKALHRDPCIFLQLDSPTDDEESEEEIPVVLFAAKEYSLLETIFNDISKMNSLHSQDQVQSDYDLSDCSDTEDGIPFEVNN